MQHESTPQYLRVSDIVTTRRAGKPEKLGILPISSATWWAWVKAKKAPAPIKLSPGVTVWDKAKVIAFAESMVGGAQ
jgi:predicted DNA-binding transcriptional regulator AlpA